MRGFAMRALALLFVALMVLLLPELAAAQSTGGSFGGGSWGGGGSSSSSGGGGHHGGGGSSDDGAAYLVFAVIRILLVTIGPIPTLILVVVGAGVWFMLRGPGARNESGRPFARPPAAGSPLWNQVDITAVRIAIDWRARDFVQKRYAELTKGVSARNKPGLVKHVSAIAQALDEARVAWLCAEVSNFHPMSPPEAEHHFRSLAEGARAALRVDASGIADPRANPSEGAVVVTVIVAATRELIDVQAHDANDLAIALRGLRSVQPHEMVAGDLVWSPEAPGARMSMRELKVRHPNMVQIAEHSIGGRTFCRSCRAPYPLGMPQCPGCGTPS